MAIMYSHDDAGYHALDTETGQTTTYKTQGEWLAASLTAISAHFERIERGLASLYTRPTDKEALVELFEKAAQVADSGDEIEVRP